MPEPRAAGEPGEKGGKAFLGRVAANTKVDVSMVYAKSWVGHDPRRGGTRDEAGAHREQPFTEGEPSSGPPGVTLLPKHPDLAFARGFSGLRNIKLGWI